MSGSGSESGSSYGVKDRVYGYDPPLTSMLSGTSYAGIPQSAPLAPDSSASSERSHSMTSIMEPAWQAAMRPSLGATADETEKGDEWVTTIGVW